MIKGFKKIGLFALFVLCGALLQIQVFAHAEDMQIKAGGKAAVELTDAQVKSIDLRTMKVMTQPLAETLILNGQIQLLPNRQANVSARISGQVTAIYTGVGRAVQLRQPLLRVQSRLVGDPPPSVNILAPIAGVIDEQNVNLGSAVEPSTVLFHISNRAQVVLISDVYEEDLNKVRIGQDVDVRILSYPKQRFPGKISLIDPNLNPATRTVKAWVILNNPDNMLKPNMFGRAHVILNKTHNALVIPHGAMIEANGESFVFIKKGNQYHRVVITTGTSDDRYIEVEKGLHLNDEIVTQGNRQLYTLWLTGGSIESENQNV